MSKSITKKLAISLLTMVLLLSLVVGGTYAYFTDSVSIDNNVITAGDISIDAELYEEGAIVGTYDVKVDKIEIPNFAPGQSATYQLTVENTGTLASQYKVVLSSTDSSLLGALTVTFGGSDMTFVKGIFSTEWTNLAKDANESKEIVITFDSSAGNEYQEKSFSFDIDVIATQEGDDAKGAMVLANDVADITDAKLTAGQTVVFLADINGSVSLTKAVNFDFNGHKLIGDLSITDNTAKTMDIGDRYLGTPDTNPEYITGNVDIEALQATVHLNVAVNGTSTINAATDSSSFHFNGGFITLKGDNTPADTQDKVGTIEVKAGKAVINAPANVVVEKKPTVAEVDDAAITQDTQIKDVEIVVNAGVTVPKLEVNANVSEDVKVENKGDIDELANNSTDTNASITLEGASPDSFSGEGADKAIGSILFAGGDGSEANPYLIDAVTQLQNMNQKDNYYYYKVSVPDQVWDASNWTSINYFRGNFDGNGLTLDNIDRGMFNFAYSKNQEQTVFQNFDLNCNIPESAMLGGCSYALVYRLPYSALIKNVNLHGVLQGGITVAYSIYGAANSDDDGNTDNTATVIFEDCISDITLMGSTDTGVFMASKEADGSLEIKDSLYKGSMVLPNNKGYEYFYTHKPYSVLNIEYSDDFLDEHNLTATASGSLYNLEDYYTVTSEAKNGAYLKEASVSSNVEALPNLGEYFAVDAAEGADYACVSLNIGANPDNLRYTYETQNIEVSNGQFVTDGNIGLWNITVGTDIDADTYCGTLNSETNVYHIQGNEFTALTYHSAIVTINQFNDQGVLLEQNIFTWSLSDLSD